MKQLSILAAAALAAAAVAAAVAAPASAQVYSGNFANLGTGGDGGWYYFTGHQASQDYTGTGLAAADQLELSLNGDYNGLDQPLTLSFQVNGVDVGSTTYNPGDNPARIVDFLFGPIASATTDYTLSAYVSGPVCAGCGAVHFTTDNAFTLSAGAVPEPASWAMMLVGFGAMGFAMRGRARRASLAQLA